jgi:nitrile hydratase beta subunit
MDGIHDLGGKHGFGRVVVEADEPVFHEVWEGRAFAMMSLFGFANVDAGRHAIERIPALDYLRLGYYGRWLRACEMRLLESGVLEPGELDARMSGEIFLGSGDAASPATPDGRPRRPATRGPGFAVGDPVRTRNLHRSGHTRLPGYARVRRGVVAIVHPDAWVLPDTHAHDRGECPEPVYAVRFDGRELWGDEAEPGTRVHIDLFESYLEHDPEGPA